jgi:transcriptional regulator GlxA family with amidase domain
LELDIAPKLWHKCHHAHEFCHIMTLKRRIAFLTYPDVKLLDVTGPLQVFSDANEVLGQLAYTTDLASLHGGPVTTDTGVVLNTRRLAGIGLDETDTLIACGGDGVYSACRDGKFVAALTRASQHCDRVAATCTGSFLLGAAGLLDGRRAVTHWKRCADLADAYPDAKIDADPIYIEDDGVWTSAGVTAGIDLALAMVEYDQGREVALELARNMLVYAKRPGGQSQFSAALKEQIRSATGRFDALHFWMADNLAADLRVDALAERSNMSPRNFARLYAQETGQTPARGVEQYRVSAAQALLENGELSIKEIVQRCGFGNDERMRRSFLRQLGVSPQAWRQRFAVNEDA